MIERRLVGRRYADFHPDAPPPLYPNELERRFSQRRTSAKTRAHFSPDALLPGQRRRPKVLFSGIVRCANCGRELRRTRNIAPKARRYFIAEYGLGDAPRCSCGAARARLEWLFQAGTE